MDLSEHDKKKLARLARDYRRRWTYLAARVVIGALWAGLAYSQHADAKRTAGEIGVSPPSFFSPRVPISEKVNVDQSRLWEIRAVEAPGERAIIYFLFTVVWLATGCVHFRMNAAYGVVEKLYPVCQE